MNEKRLLFILATVQFCHIIDFMIIMPLGKTIMEVFTITPGQFSRVVTAYAAAAVVGNLVSTAVIDRFDRRTALLFLFTGFAIGTLACAFAPSYEVLLISRFGTGLFGGTLGALVLAIVGDVIPLERRGAAMGWVMTAFSAASVAGVPAGIYIAADYGWQIPFIVVAALSAGFITLSYFLIPPLRGHLAEASSPTPAPATAPLLVNTAEERQFRAEGALDDIAQQPTFQMSQRSQRRDSVFLPFKRILEDANQRAALLFTLALMLGHFTIIPFIAPYMQLNIGFADKQVSLIYLCGGLLTVVLLPLFGKLADRFGRLRVFTIASVFALFSIFALTNLETDSITVALLVSSSFFVVASGRSVPATTMITSVVRPENRGSFMSIRQSVNELALAVSSFVAGLIITEAPDGSLQHYDWVGYFTMGMSLVAVYAASRIKAVA